MKYNNIYDTIMMVLGEEQWWMEGNGHDKLQE
jgi:hypothetical protein